MSTLLAVSPHLDDAIFSAGGMLIDYARRGWRVIVATVFTGSVTDPTGFALACQLDKGLGAEVDYMALRRAEDERACAMIGAEPMHLGLLEAPHRGYDNAAALFGARRQHDLIELDADELLTAGSPDLVLLPLSLGGHVDHVLVEEAFAGLRDHPAPPALCWEDWPYADRLTLDRKTASALRLDQDTRALKADACACYASQLGFQFGGEAAMRARIMANDVEWFHSAASA